MKHDVTADHVRKLIDVVGIELPDSGEDYDVAISQALDELSETFGRTKADWKTKLTQIQEEMERGQETE